MIQIINAESWFIRFNRLPFVSSCPTLLPAIASEKNHIQDTAIQDNVKIHFSNPEYTKELVPITPIVSKIACGFNRETDAAKKICFFAVKGVDCCLFCN